jgi:hypothetical protein
MTRLTGNSQLRRETCAVVQRKHLVIELRARTVYLRLKGARWGYEVDYQSIWVLGAKKAAEQLRIERQNRRKQKKRQW